MKEMQFGGKYVLSNGKLLKNAVFSVSNGRITSLDTSISSDAVFFHDSIIIPGLTNTHTHSMQSLMRGSGDDTDLLVWLREKVYEACSKMDDYEVYVAALLSFTEMLQNGITSVVDFFYLNKGGNECAKAVIRAAKHVGIRLVLARTMMDWEDAPGCIRETPAEAERNFINLYDSYRHAESHIKICPAPHSAYGASKEMILLAKELSESYSTSCHMHVSDSKSAMALTRKITGMEYVDYLSSLGILNNSFVAVHCIHCDENAQDTLARAGAFISHNPVSNMFLGEPAAPVASLLKKGMTVGLGTDGAASNNRLSILQEMKIAALHQKSSNENPKAIAARDLMGMATTSGAMITGFSGGDILPGMDADFIVLGLDNIELYPERFINSHLVYSLTEAAIQRVYVGGNLAAINGRALNVDYNELRQKANTFALRAFK